VSRWRCPSCGREFDRARQAHVCEPGIEVDDVFDGRPPWQREAYDALVEPLRRLGELHEDAVGVGVFLKRQRKVAEVRPMATRLRVLAFLPGEVPSAAVVRRLPIGDRVLHVVDLRSTADVDGPLADLLLEAWEDAG
jgi:hypothetical protein